MSAAILGFIIGFMFGGMFGVMTLALLVASRDEERGDGHENFTKHENPSVHEGERIDNKP